MPHTESATAHMELSKKVLAANESQTLAIAARAKAMKAKGLDVVSLSTGEPDFPTPTSAKEAAIRAIEEDFTRYVETNGIPELREAAAHKFREENGIAEATTESVLISAGVKQSLFVALTAMCNDGDEVVTIAPYWVTYPSMITMCGATPVVVPTEYNERYKVRPERLRAALTSKTKCVILNTPANPTGTMYTPEELRELASVLEEHDCYIISDEIYEKIVYGDVPHVSIGSFPELEGRVLTANGVAKAFSMPGWRIGYMHGPAEVIKQANKVQGQSTSHPCTISQKAALAALLYAGEDVETMRREFILRRDLICDLLGKTPDIHFHKPDGAFYIFANVQEYLGGEISTSAALCEYVLDKHHLALVPGEAFGAPGCVRFSFATSRETIAKGAERFANALAELKR